jgi:ribosomal protein S27AE
MVSACPQCGGPKPKGRTCSTVCAGKKRRTRPTCPIAQLSQVIGQATVALLLKNQMLRRPARCSSCHERSRPLAHHDDYTQPAKVRWLCGSCHRQWHEKNQPIHETSLIEVGVAAQAALRPAAAIEAMEREGGEV